MKTELNSLQIKEILRGQINNNMALASKGKCPIAFEIEGMPGTAKTSVAKQVASEFGHYYVRLNLSEIEVPDLVGLPVYEYEISKDGIVQWVTDKVLAAFIATGFVASGKHRTSYAKPSWIEGKEDKPIILVLDDYNRVTPMMANACMTLIDEQRYISWNLPLGSTIILTCNPSDQDFMVQTEDSAQATRRLKLYMKADVNIWASEFAEEYGVDSRCINFLLKYPEVIEGTADKTDDGITFQTGNLRIWTKYFDAISGIQDFDKDLPLLMNLGSGSLSPQHIQLFSAFIKNGLDKLLSPQELLKRHKTAVEDLRVMTYPDGTTKRQDISAIMSKRLLNYCVTNENILTEQDVDTYGDLLDSDLLSRDLVVLTMKKICAKPKFRKLLERKKLISIVAGE